jgi:hypothetical protein
VNNRGNTCSHADYLRATATLIIEHLEELENLQDAVLKAEIKQKLFRRHRPFYNRHVHTGRGRAARGTPSAHPYWRAS